MSAKTSIEWTDATWNPVRGCTKVSAGCRNCYAERFAERWRGVPGHAFEQGFDLRLVPEALELPLKWKNPKRIFVNSVSDLFHKDVPDEYILRVLNIVRACHARDKGHIFQILTKRADRMADLMPRLRFDGSGEGRMWFAKTANDFEGGYPLGYGHRGATGLKNLWLGVSVENQAAADERIAYLVRTPAFVRFLSCEPLLGPVDLQKARTIACPNKRIGGCELERRSGHRITQDSEAGGIWVECACSRLSGIDWVIAGGESGPGARPMHPDWLRSLRDQCFGAGVPFFFKQWGEYVSVSEVAGSGAHHYFPDGATVRKVGKLAAGRRIDGLEHNGMPDKRC